MLRYPMSATDGKVGAAPSRTSWYVQASWPAKKQTHPAAIHCHVRRSSGWATRRPAKKQQYAAYADAHSQHRPVTSEMVGWSCGGNTYSSRIPANESAAMAANRRAGRLRGITRDSEGNLTALCFAANEPPRLDAYSGALAHGMGDRKSTRLNSSHMSISYA